MARKKLPRRRQTQQRAALRGVFEEIDRPLLAPEILHEARRQVPSLNLATVYRNLKSLVAQGFLRQVFYQPLGALYERADKPHHHHFFCEGCQQMLELEGCSVNIRSAVPAGFEVRAHELFIEGLCPSCSGPKPERR